MPILSDILAKATALLQLEGTDAATDTKILAAVSAVMEGQATEIDLLQQILAEFGPPRLPTSLKFDVPILLTKQGVPVMPGTVTVTSDHDVRIPLKWADDVGTVLPRPGGTVVTSSDTTICSGADVAADDLSIVARTVANGTCTLTIDNPGPPDLNDTLTLIVAIPTPTSLQADAAGATAVPKGTAA